MQARWRWGWEGGGGGALEAFTHSLEFLQTPMLPQSVHAISSRGWGGGGGGASMVGREGVGGAGKVEMGWGRGGGALEAFTHKRTGT